MIDPREAIINFSDLSLDERGCRLLVARPAVTLLKNTSFPQKRESIAFQTNNGPLLRGGDATRDFA